MVITALGGTWFIEQPERSTYCFFPPFMNWLSLALNAAGTTAVLP